MTPKKRRRASERFGADEARGAVNNRLVKALSHPLRARALAILNERVASPKEIADQLGEPVGNVSYHVNTLHKLECIELVKEVQRRGAVEHYFRGTTRSFLSDENWAALSPDAKSGVSVAGLRMINDAAKAAILAKTFDARADRHLSCTPVDLDEQGWQETMSLLTETLDRVIAIQAESATRRANARETSSVRATISLLGFESPPPSGAESEEK